MESIRLPLAIVAFVISLLSLASTARMITRNRKQVQRAAEDAYTEGVRYGLAQRRHEWYAGYRQGQREERRRQQA